jgi:hypothetical protein
MILNHDIAVRLVWRAAVKLGKRGDPKDVASIATMAREVVDAVDIPGLDESSIADAKRAARFLLKE